MYVILGFLCMVIGFTIIPQEGYSFQMQSPKVRTDYNLYRIQPFQYFGSSIIQNFDHVLIRIVTSLGGRNSQIYVLTLPPGTTYEEGEQIKAEMEEGFENGDDGLLQVNNPEVENNEDPQGYDNIKVYGDWGGITFP